MIALEFVLGVVLGSTLTFAVSVALLFWVIQRTSR